jgi:hypothetical protein
MSLRAGLLGGLGGLVYVLLVRGSLAPDLGVGRRVRSLGPFTRHVAAPPETVFDVIASPYLDRTPKALGAELKVLDRGSDMVLAAHYTPVSLGLTAVTVETVGFRRPSEITFRLVRGPVPSVIETFELIPDGDATEWRYTGELGTDLWALGAWWGDRVAAAWEKTVLASMEKVASEAERRAARR